MTGYLHMNPSDANEGADHLTPDEQRYGIHGAPEAMPIGAAIAAIVDHAPSVRYFINGETGAFAADDVLPPGDWVEVSREDWRKAWSRGASAPVPRELVDALQLVAGHLLLPMDLRLAADGQLVEWGFVADSDGVGDYPTRDIAESGATS